MASWWRKKATDESVTTGNGSWKRRCVQAAVVPDESDREIAEDIPATGTHGSWARRIAETE